MTYDAVVFGAHPDDAEMGMGGTVARLAQDGRSVLLVSLTRGECSTFGTPEQRAQESAAAAGILGCQHRLLDFPDTRIVADVAAREQIMDVVRELQPRIVFAPWYASTSGHHDGAAHVDHLATGAVVRQAVRLARLRGKTSQQPPHDVSRLYYYMVPRDRDPALYVDVSDTYDTLVKAIAAYESQMAIRRHGKRILDVLQTYRAWHGVRAGCAYAEAFLTDDPLRLDSDRLFDL